jgi:hypothetical protein
MKLVKILLSRKRKLKARRRQKALVSLVDLKRLRVMILLKEFWKFYQMVMDF